MDNNLFRIVELSQEINKIYQDDIEAIQDERYINYKIKIEHGELLENKLVELRDRLKLFCDEKMYRSLPTEMCDKSYELGNISNWMKWSEEIPYINFPKDWKIRIVPPFRGATVRFYVTTDELHQLGNTPDHPGRNRISIYLDCNGILANTKKPYWEVLMQEDVERCDMNNTKKLIKIINKAIKEQLKGNK